MFLTYASLEAARSSGLRYSRSISGWSRWVSLLLPGPLAVPVQRLPAGFADTQAGQDRTVGGPPGRTCPPIGGMAVVSVPGDRWSEQVAIRARSESGPACVARAWAGPGLPGRWFGRVAGGAGERGLGRGRLRCRAGFQLQVRDDRFHPAGASTRRTSSCKVEHDPHASQDHQLTMRRPAAGPAALRQPGDLMSVEVVGVDLGQQPRDTDSGDGSGGRFVLRGGPGAITPPPTAG